MFQNNTSDIEFLLLFGRGRLLIIAGILLYLIAGAAVFSFMPETYDWLRADTRRTVQAYVVSNTAEYRHSNSSAEKKVYRVTLEYEVNGIKRTHTEYSNNELSGKRKLHVYCTRDGRWEVRQFSLLSILALTALAAAAALHGTHMFAAARRQKQAKTGETQ